ncbi:MAG: hypothetical protein H5T99_09125, partial [Moorella sp. (in: Bacteria)]|nr:hypothetical protein [Moorella sp. (in: firmicutes)]
MKVPRRDRYFTLMLVPEGRQGIYRYILPAWLPRAVAVLLVAGAVALGTAAGAVYFLQKRVAELKAIDEINAVQARQISQLQEEARSLQEKMAEIDRLDTQVRALLGLDGGGGQRPGEASRGG